ncbi:substrate-binding domain-containing protein (plasmid) [Ralstonia solanacearum]|uniref:ABC transporter substrate-binding protein n=1 Tax=Ralstonia solanacearum TaxID=305 RepID=UPI0006DC316A|nr:substrate-binding domain-containing protein [Ralstonia solanacearum]QHB57120.1 substrate-binding domain-containing protein [Ralstonia solanacearum]
MKQTIGACMLASVLWLAGLPQAWAQTVPHAWAQWLATASARHQQWSGPRSGPPAVAGTTVAVISEDLRNGGILGVAKGIKEAAGAIGWSTRVYDAGGTPAGRARAVASALASQPGGVILVGVDAREMKPQLQPFAERGIPMVGWHVSPFAGPIPGSPVAVNVSTDPVAVARVTAMATIARSGGHAGIVVFTDSNFQIAKAKSAAMAEVIRACQGCHLLEVRDVAISRSAELMPAITRELLARYGDDWTDTLAINDLYFDYAAPELTKAGRPSASMRMLSAGDGSAAAFTRIRAGTFQVGTVAEPLNQQGWQLVDELNRLLAHASLSGYVAPVHLVTRENIASDGGPQGLYDPDNGYRTTYRRIWKP